MDLYVPSEKINKDINKLKEKIMNQKMIKGFYRGYHLSNNTIISFFKSFNGWNVFINESLSDHLAEALQYVIDNKTSILFIMSEAKEQEINIMKE